VTCIGRITSPTRSHNNRRQALDTRPRWVLVANYPKVMTVELLRAKYGPPHGSKFTISPGFEIVVAYAPDQQVRKIELPGTAPDATGASTAQRVDDVLLELVPMLMRGKEVGSMHRAIGSMSWKNMFYEHVMIVETGDPWAPGQRLSVTVWFRDYQSNSTS
jgi:hypothetical protein